MSAKIKIWDSRVKAIVLVYNKHKSQFVQKFCPQNRWHKRGNLPSWRSQPSVSVSVPGDMWLVSSVTGKNDHFLAYLVNTVQWKEAQNCCVSKQAKTAQVLIHQEYPCSHTVNVLNSVAPGIAHNVSLRCCQSLQRDKPVFEKRVLRSYCEAQQMGGSWSGLLLSKKISKYNYSAN